MSTGEVRVRVLKLGIIFRPKKFKNVSDPKHDIDVEVIKNWIIFLSMN